ncbi:hypothetical protein ACE41H_16765 [Paenibacillus enshidis]|uniref:Uncharacterized protein n=1 Tax=Paenibacillus enshidis TaxID=1458439 RepID=A0ABV5AW30_9BACL
MSNQKQDHNPVSKLKTEMINELEQYEEHEQIAILTKITNDLKKGPYRSRILRMREFLLVPNWTVVISVGLLLPIIIGALIIWFALYVE